MKTFFVKMNEFIFYHYHCILFDIYQVLNRVFIYSKIYLKRTHSKVENSLGRKVFFETDD